MDLTAEALDEAMRKEPNSSPYALDLHNRGISKIKGLTKFCSLRSLDLSFNTIAVLEGLEGLQALRELKIHGNRLTVLQGLTKNVRLEALFVHSNALRSIEPTRCLSNLIHLKTLRLSRNELEDGSLESIALCKRLTDVDLSNNRLTTVEPLAGLVLLQSLSVADNELHTLRGLSHMAQLYRLDVAGNRLDTLRGVDGLVSLSELKADRNCLHTLSSLTTLPALSELYLSHNRLQAIDGLSAVAPECLEVLDISWNNMEALAPALQELKGLKCLKQLMIGGNKFSLVRLAEGCGWWDSVVEQLPELLWLEGSHIEDGCARVTHDAALSSSSTSSLRPNRQIASSAREVAHGSIPVARPPGKHDESSAPKKTAPLLDIEAASSQWRARLSEIKGALHASRPPPPPRPTSNASATSTEDSCSLPRKETRKRRSLGRALRYALQVPSKPVADNNLPSSASGSPSPPPHPVSADIGATTDLEFLHGDDDYLDERGLMEEDLMSRATEYAFGGDHAASVDGESSSDDGDSVKEEKSVRTRETRLKVVPAPASPPIS